MRIYRALRWGLTVFVAPAVPFFIYLWTWVPTDAQRHSLIWAALFLAVCWLVTFIGYSPPWVKVTSGQVSVWGDYGAWLLQRLPRSDIGYIFRGQARMGKYHKWARAYFLVTLDDTPQITIAADDFTDEGMTDVATRLNVPIKGDFTAQVN